MVIKVSINVNQDQIRITKDGSYLKMGKKTIKDQNKIQHFPEFEGVTILSINFINILTCKHFHAVLPIEGKLPMQQILTCILLYYVGRDKGGESVGKHLFFAEGLMFKGTCSL